MGIKILQSNKKNVWRNQWRKQPEYIKLLHVAESFNKETNIHRKKDKPAKETHKYDEEETQ
jgi:hypothetical protein